MRNLVLEGAEEFGFGLFGRHARNALETAAHLLLGLDNLALALLEGTLGSDFGLVSLPGFKETGEYPDIVTGPSGRTFNYADSYDGRAAGCALWWFAWRFNRPDLLVYYERDAFRRAVASRDFSPNLDGARRLLPYALLWMRPVPDGLKPSVPLVWDGQGRVPIAIQRSSWDDAKALFVGLKGGSPYCSHGHMDCGSFVLESERVRWAVDLGPEQYHRIESMGMDLWNLRQGSQRWTVFRLGTSSHNVPMIDGCQQFVDGLAKLVAVKRTGAASEVTLDLSSMYTNAASVVRTGAMAADGRRYLLHDTFAGVRPGAAIRWAMMTRATPTVDGDAVTLRQDGKSIRLCQQGVQKGAWVIGDGHGPNKWDSPNPGCSQLIFTVPARADGTADVAVEFSF